MKKAVGVAFLSLTLWLTAGSLTSAHFQMIIPSDDIVSQSDRNEIELDVMFMHPFEGGGMNMKMPINFGVFARGKKKDLLNSLNERQIRDRTGKNHNVFKAEYSIKRPGDHIFYVEPKPYWEPAEEIFIIHYTKVIVNAFGLEEGWDKALGQKAEIIPLTRPYGLWAGNVFQGIVKVKGKPVPFSKVEVEYYNKDGTVKAPADPMITQVIKADANGVFTYSMPKAGWWGFAALNEDEKKINLNGKAYPVEIGAILWVRTYEMP